MHTHTHTTTTLVAGDDLSVHSLLTHRGLPDCQTKVNRKINPPFIKGTQFVADLPICPPAPNISDKKMFCTEKVLNPSATFN